jgi:hypothetical protein
VFGGGGGKSAASYFIVAPQHSGHAEAVNRSMSRGLTLMDFLHFPQTIVRVMIPVFLAVLIAILPQLKCRRAFKCRPRLRNRLH